MALEIQFLKAPRKQSDTAALFVYEGEAPGAAFKNIDKASGGMLSHIAGKSSKFKGKYGESLHILLPPKSPFAQILLVGLGKPEKIDILAVENAGGRLFPLLAKAGITHLTVFAEAHTKTKNLKGAELGVRFAAGIRLRSYSFNTYKTKKKDEPAALSKIDVIGQNAAASTDLMKFINHEVDGVFTARNFINEPPNVLYPDAYAKRIQRELKPLGVYVEILDDKRMEKLGMGAILGVGQGSDRKPRMVIMHWSGGKARSKTAPLALVGKGITFDSGGISIKPGPGMEEMKMDMAGSAAVVGTMKTLALRKSKANVVGIVALAENMPSSNAYRPADILTSYSGKTIEVLNTDAEGRLVLADALTYIQEQYKPKTVIDLATLTGAMLVALGHEYCGTFVNNDALWQKLEAASKASGEKLWRMPLDEVWKKDMEGSVSDVQNLGKSGRNAGACTAAGFLEHFIEDGVAWAHLDIAGTAWIKSDRPTVPKPATGFGVRALNHLIAEHFE